MSTYQAVDDSYFDPWKKLRTGNIYQAIIPYGPNSPADFPEPKLPYLIEPVFNAAGVVTGAIYYNGQNGQPLLENSNHGMRPAVYQHNAENAASDDYLGTHLFTWYRGNGFSDIPGCASLDVVEEDENLDTNERVWTYGPAFWYRVTDDVPVPGSSYKCQLWEVSDYDPYEGPNPNDGDGATDGLYHRNNIPRASKGFDIWPECMASAGVYHPYWLHPAFVSPEDLGSSKGAAPGRKGFSYARLVSSTPDEEGKPSGDAGLWIGRTSTQLFGMLFGVIKYGTRSLGKHMPGNIWSHDTYWEIAAATQKVIVPEGSDERANQTFVLSRYDADNLSVGDCISIGQDTYNHGILRPESAVCTVKWTEGEPPDTESYSVDTESLVVLTKEDNPDGTVTITTDSEQGFPTVPGDMCHLYFSQTGITDKLTELYGKVDGTYGAPKELRQVFRLMGTEYQGGVRVLSGDVLFNYQANSILCATRGNSKSVISVHKDPLTGQIFAFGDYHTFSSPALAPRSGFILDIHVDTKYGIFWPTRTSIEERSSGWHAYFDRIPADQVTENTTLRCVAHGGSLYNAGSGGLATYDANVYPFGWYWTIGARY